MVVSESKGSVHLNEEAMKAWEKRIKELGFVQGRGYAVWYGMAGVWGAYPLLNSLSNDL
jgi:hypothetical protein